MRFCLLIPAALAIASAAGAQQTGNPNLERVANDAYTRTHDYDLVHQRISVRDFNWDSTSFNGRVATTLVARRAAMDSVILDAGAGLRIERVTAGSTGSGASLRQRHTGDTLVVYLARPVAFGDTTSFTIDYHADITSGHGLTFIAERPTSPRQIWSQGEATDNHYWFPTYDAPNDKMTWELDATVPSVDMAVSNGAFEGDTRAAGGTHTLHWNQTTPSATYLVSLVVAPLAKVHDAWRNVPVDAYVYHRDSALAPRLFHITDDMIDTYSRLTGVPYPWAKYAQTTVADFFGGMENVSATTLVDWLPDANAYQDRPWYQYILIPHELAHQWFGDYVTTENWANTWLNEGFAEFMPGQYWAQKLGAHAEQDYYADEYRQFMGIEKQRPMPLASMGSNNIYPKGALVLEMLKHYLGEQRFWAGLHRYLTDHEHGVATTDDLRQAFLDATGQNLDWFWSEWIYAAGYPAFTVTQQYDAAARRLTLIAAQTQTDSLKADSTGMRYPIPEAFTMPVDVRVRSGGRDLVAHTWIRQRVDTIVVDSVAAPPSMVVFDDGNQILKTLKFDEPTDWLAEQLASDPDLWDREWVIGQLAARSSDPAARAAIAKAATSADYFETRVVAAQALAKVTPAAALPSLARAAHDTSAQVRAAAVASLGAMASPAALAMADSAWNRDASYTVRAAALTSISRLDSSAATRALLRRALAIPSYRSAIQNAALFAMSRTVDTGAVSLIQQHVGDQALPAQLLAVLSGHGSASALATLTADLNDDRAYVRQWALNAMQILPPPARAAALRTALPHLTHAETRAAVQRALGAGAP
jgi:aminopeptidase N